MEENRHSFFIRSNILLVIFSACLIAFIFLLHNAQIVNGSKYLAQASTQVPRSETVVSSRGIITDRNGKVLVTNREIYTITFDPSLVPTDSSLVPDNAALSRKRSVALAAYRLISLCRQYGVAWNDGLPVTSQPPFAYTISTTTDVQRSRLQGYLRDRGWSETAITANTSYPMMSDALKTMQDTTVNSLSANRLMTLMREDFGLPEDMSAGDARLVIGVLYELALRSLNENAVTIQYVFAEDVSVELISILTDGQFDGVVIGHKSERQYNTDYAAHILGRVGDIATREERDALNEPYNTAKAAGEDVSGIHYYQWDDKVGKDGVEKAFEDYLCGLDGRRLITTDRDGKITSELYSVEPQPGGTVALTIDIDFQAEVEQALATRIEEMIAADGIEDRGGAAVVLDISDSSVLAMATYPTYSQRTYKEDLAELSTNPGRPFVNRALSGTYSPGSTFKLCTAAAGMETGVITPTSTIYTKGRYTYFKDYQPACWIYRQYGGSHGSINVSQAIYHSCNYFFYDVGRQVGIDRLNEFVKGFGLGQPTGIELWEAKGIMASPEYSESQGLTWNPGDVLQIAIGHSSVYTPLQIANYAATVVRGGERYACHLLKDIISYDGNELLYSHEPELLDSVEMSPGTLAAIKKGTGDLVRTGGVASYFKSCVVSAGAKTGSVQMGDGQTNGVFICYAPFENPEIAVAIVIEKGNSGSALASAAVGILNAYFSGSGTAGAALIPEGELLP
ncbi:MAG: penicillin-binding protein A [Oscillospiraceae bacterium]|nr:penicillin-binding protein A [Oscillospiraceae bacterium]